MSRYETLLDEERKIQELMEGVSLDFDDALQYYVAKTENLTLVTLDANFARVKDIKVISPNDITI